MELLVIIIVVFIDLKCNFNNKNTGHILTDNDVFRVRPGERAMGYVWQNS